MSEHKLNTTRYWLREEPDDNTVYFVTESNAAHARAEGDRNASEISQDEYEEHVPPDARERPYDATNGAPHTPAKPASNADEIINQYRAQCAATMIGAHQQIMNVLLTAPITHAERIFVLEMIKAELVQSMLHQPQQSMATN